MIRLTTVEPERFVAPWHEKEKQPPTYLLRAGTVWEREELQAELAGRHMAAGVYPGEYIEAFRGGVTALLESAEAERLAALYEQDRREAMAAAAEEREAERLDPGEEATVNEAVKILTANWPPFASLVEREARRNALLPVLAFRRFCTGWENVDAEFATSADGGVADEAMSQLPPLELRAAGFRAYRLLNGRGEAKNSDAPSKSAGGRTTSNSGAPSKEAG